MDEILLKLDKGWQCGNIELNPNECKVLLQYIQKVQMSSLYEKHKNVDIYIIIKDSKTGTNDFDFKNVEVEIKEKFIQVYDGAKYFNYNISEVVFYELRDSIDREYIENDIKIIQDYIKNNDKIESEVK